MIYKVITGKSGLANKLFPWARAVVYKDLYGGNIINPDWENYFKIGPYLRNEKDKRHYFRVFNNIDYVKKFKEFFLPLRYGKIEEISFLEAEDKTVFRNKIVLCQGFVGKGLPSYFESIVDHRELIYKELIKISNPKLIPDVDSENSFIGVHIRLGDFIEVMDYSELKIKILKSLRFRIPLNWYSDCIFRLRNAYGYSKEVRVFSDGTEEQLEEILKISNVKLIKGNSALTDMLLLSKSDVLVCSGSTFSMWAAYLGQCSSIFFPNSSRGDLIGANKREKKFQFEWEEGEFPDEVLNILRGLK